MKIWKHLSVALPLFLTLHFGDASGQALITLYNFGGVTNDGASPAGALVQGIDSNFYGTTSSGGTNADGTVFRITPQGTLTTLHSFRGSDGASPEGALVQGNDGYFYGTTSIGGPDAGTVFRISNQGTFTNLYQFSCCYSDGS